MSEAVEERGLSGRTSRVVRDVLEGRRSGGRAALALAGPAVITSVAYMDPGNFATNIQAGARYGYALLWVVVAASGIAMLFQAMSAKLGIVTNRNLAELCRDQFPRPAVIAMWLVSELAAMATDLAEFLGGAIGLSLLLHIPLLWGMAATGAITYAILTIERSGFRPMELVIAGLIGIIGLSYVLELVIAPPQWGEVALHSVVPALPDVGAVTLCVGMVGATVMPHAIYLHSGLTQSRTPARNPRERRRLVQFSNREVAIALGLAALVNLAMVVMAATVFHQGHSDVGEIEQAYTTLIPLLGAGAAWLFLASLMASGISSSVVGTMAGQVIMQGFIGYRVPIWVRRLATMLPSFAVVATGYNATEALVMSQVVLSIALPVPMIALVVLSRRRSVMGAERTGGGIFALSVAMTAVVLGLNLLLVLQMAGVGIPGLG